MAVLPNLINPIDQNFSCHNCGLCCTTPWKVKVAPERAKLIETTRSYQSLKRESFVPLPMIEGEIQVGRRSDGACGFHQDGGCAVHRELGAPSKPTVCQLYPFSLVNSPEGYYLSLSFSCPSVLLGDGDSLDAQLKSVEETIAASSYYSGETMQPNTTVPLTLSKTVDWATYLKLEQALIEHLNFEMPIKSLLRAAASLLDWAPETEWNPQHFLPETVQSLAGHFPLVIASVIATLEGFLEENERDQFCEALFQGEALHSKLLHCTLPEFELRGPDSDEHKALVKRFLLNQILGKQIVSQGSLASGLLRMAVALAVLFFYLEARKSAKPYEHGDIAWCFRLVESSLVGHSDKLAELFLGYEQVPGFD